VQSTMDVLRRSPIVHSTITANAAANKLLDRRRIVPNETLPKKPRNTPGTLSESIREDLLSPKKWASTEAAAVRIVECPETFRDEREYHSRAESTKNQRPCPDFRPGLP
jgi:hypothetical protein